MRWRRTISSNRSYGTSLGVDLMQGESAEAGHEHHLRAINRIRRAGSIRAAVDSGVLKSGIMYECVKHNVEFTLCGSIRDDGPLPDVITDTLDGAAHHAEQVRDIKFCLMIATTLHSIAVGNLLPAWVKVVCVDINPSTVIKLERSRVVSDSGFGDGCRAVLAGADHGTPHVGGQCNAMSHMPANCSPAAHSDVSAGSLRDRLRDQSVDEPFVGSRSSRCHRAVATLAQSPGASRGVDRSHGSGRRIAGFGLHRQCRDDLWQGRGPARISSIPNGKARNAARSQSGSRRMASRS